MRVPLGVCEWSGESDTVKRFARRACVVVSWVKAQEQQVQCCKSRPAPRKRRRAPPGGKKRNLISGAVEHGCRPYLARASSRICRHTTVIRSRHRRLMPGSGDVERCRPKAAVHATETSAKSQCIRRNYSSRPCRLLSRPSVPDKVTTTCTRPKYRQTRQEDGDAASDYAKGRQMSKKGGKAAPLMSCGRGRSFADAR